jgi:flagellar hook-basal body complex protein FliE
VNQLQKDADVAFQRLATGQTQNVTEVFTAVEKADLAFKTLMQIRNKLVDAYNDIRQMRI